MVNAAGNCGPLIFLDDEKKLESKALKQIDRKGHPPGSTVIILPSAYMNDVAWIQLVPIICKGICAMPVISYRIYWLVMMSLDGNSSHINVHESLKVVAEYKIVIVKEEDYTSQGNQAYDQAVAISDNYMILSLLDTVHTRSKKILSHFDLISIFLQALKTVNSASWVISFKKVNMHPKFRLSFPECILSIETQLDTDESFYVSCTGLFDAMPSLCVLPVTSPQSVSKI